MTTATEQARSLLAQAPLTRHRFAHSLGVGKAAATLVENTTRPAGWVDEVVATATLHDIGYAYPDTGMHAIDGGRHLKTLGYPAEICAQVAWHSTARHEVAARGLDIDLVDEFGHPDPLIQAIVWVSDFTTSPTGQPIALADRIADIRNRYPEPGSPVIAALDAAAPHFAEAVALLTTEPGLQLPEGRQRLCWSPAAVA